MVTTTIMGDHDDADTQTVSQLNQKNFHKLVVPVEHNMKSGTSQSIVASSGFDIFLESTSLIFEVETITTTTMTFWLMAEQ